MIGTGSAACTSSEDRCPDAGAETGSIPSTPLLSPGPPQESFNSPIDRRADYYRLTALQNLRNKGSAAVRPFNNIPNALTLSRVLMVPLFVAAWFSKADAAPALAATIFILASLTGGFAAVGCVEAAGRMVEAVQGGRQRQHFPPRCADWLDGYLARRLQLTSPFGAFLDPVADKIMCAARRTWL